MLFTDVSNATDSTVGAPLKFERRGCVIHTTMGYKSRPWLQGGSAREGRPASADFLIDRNGDIWQLTRQGRYAFHAGSSRWGAHQQPDGTINAMFHGVELECAEQHGERITDAQYIACAALVRQLQMEYGYPINMVTLHRDVALPLGRKKDPLVWNWSIFLREYLFPSKESATIKWPVALP